MQRGSYKSNNTTRNTGAQVLQRTDRNNLLVLEQANAIASSNTGKLLDFPSHVNKKIKKEKTSPVTVTTKKLPRASDPIRNKEDIERFKDYFLNRKSGRWHYRNYMLFVMGINTGRRCGDLVKLRIEDVVDFKNNCIVDKISIFKEEKTKKLFKYMYLNSAAKEAIQLYFNDKYNGFPSLANADDFLFSSQVQNRTKKLTNLDAIGHIGVRPAWAILNKAAKELGIDQSKCNIGTHSLRKTLGYQKYKLGCQRGDTSVLTTLMVAFNHNSPDVTTRYIGITDDEMKEFMMNDVL